MSNGRYSLITIGGLAGGAILSMSVIACLGGRLVESFPAYKRIIEGVSLLLAIYLLYVTICLRRHIRDYIKGEYSSDEDFPLKFASSVVFVPLFATLLSWGVYMCDRPAVTAGLNIVIAIVGLILLLIILNPQRSGGSIGSLAISDGIDPEFQNAEEKPEQPEDVCVCEQKPGVLPGYMKDRMEQQIRALVNDKQLFLRPGLTRSELSEMLGSNRTYLSIVFKERFGSFYGYINGLRMEYAVQYAIDHPEADRNEIAVNSGFGSAKTYDRVKKAYLAGELNQKVDN